MTLAENITKFGKIVSGMKSEGGQPTVVHVARALVMADTKHLGDSERGKYEHLTLDGLADTHILEFDGVCYGCNGSHEPISDVMQMRIMCDTLTLMLKGDQPFALKYSADVAKAMGLRERTKTVDYLEYAECEDILNSYYDKVASYDEALKLVFERTSFYLSELKRIQPTVNKSKSIISSSCVSGVWLPSDFDDFGFDVCKDMPSRFGKVDGSLSDLVLMYNFSYIMDVLVRVVAGNKTDMTACVMFVSRIDEMCSAGKELVPIGIKVLHGVRPSVYCPIHFMVNETVKVMYKRLFAEETPISDKSVGDAIEIISRYYKVRNGGV